MASRGYRHTSSGTWHRGYLIRNAHGNFYGASLFRPFGIQSRVGNGTFFYAVRGGTISYRGSRSSGREDRRSLYCFFRAILRSAKTSGCTNTGGCRRPRTRNREFTRRYNGLSKCAINVRSLGLSNSHRVGVVGRPTNSHYVGRRGGVTTSRYSGPISVPFLSKFFRYLMNFSQAFLTNAPGHGFRHRSQRSRGGRGRRVGRRGNATSTLSNDM